MGRSIQRGSKGIPLLQLSGNEKATVFHVFDVAQTGANERSKTPNIWEMSQDLEEPMIERLTSLYGEVSAQGYGNQLMALCEKVAEQHTSPFLADLLRDRGDSSIEDFENEEITHSFQNVLKESLQIMTLSRCGLNPEEYITENNLLDLPCYDTHLLVSHLGNAIQTISSEVLLNMEKLAKEQQVIKQAEIQSEKNLEKSEKTLAISDDMLYDIVGINYDKIKQVPTNQTEVENNGRTNQPIRETRGDLLRGRGRSTVPQPDRGERGGQGVRGLHSGDVRQSEKQILEGTSERDTHQNGDGRHMEKTPVRNGYGSRQNVGESHRPDDGQRGSDGRSQNERPSPLGSTGREHQRTGEGNSPDRTNLQLDSEESYEQTSIFPSAAEENEKFQQAIEQRRQEVKAQSEKIKQERAEEPVSSAHFSAQKPPEPVPTTEEPEKTTILYSEASKIGKYRIELGDFEDKELPYYKNEEGKEFAFGYFSMGNGLSVSNYLSEVDKDYERVAQIHEDGTLKIYDQTLPEVAIAELEQRSQYYKEERTNQSSVNVATPEPRSVSETPEKSHSTKLWEKYQDIQSQHESDIVFLQNNDFYEIMGDNVKELPEELDVRVLHRDCDGEKVPIYGFAAHALEDYKTLFQEHGYDVVVSDGKDSTERFTATSPVTEKTIPVEIDRLNREIPQDELIAEILEVNEQARNPYNPQANPLDIEVHARDPKADLPINSYFMSYTNEQLKMALEQQEKMVAIPKMEEIAQGEQAEKVSNTPPTLEVGTEFSMDGKDYIVDSVSDLTDTVYLQEKDTPINVRVMADKSEISEHLQALKQQAPTQAEPNAEVPEPETPDFPFQVGDELTLVDGRTYAIKTIDLEESVVYLADLSEENPIPYQRIIDFKDCQAQIVKPQEEKAEIKEGISQTEPTPPQEQATITIILPIPRFIVEKEKYSDEYPYSVVDQHFQGSKYNEANLRSDENGNVGFATEEEAKDFCAKLNTVEPLTTKIEKEVYSLDFPFAVGDVVELNVGSEVEILGITGNDVSIKSISTIEKPEATISHQAFQEQLEKFHQEHPQFAPKIRTDDDFPRYVVMQTSDAWEEPFVVLDRSFMGEDTDLDKYLHEADNYITFETEEEAQTYCSQKNFIDTYQKLEQKEELSVLPEEKEISFDGGIPSHEEPVEPMTEQKQNSQSEKLYTAFQLSAEPDWQENTQKQNKIKGALHKILDDAPRTEQLWALIQEIEPRNQFEFDRIVNAMEHNIDKDENTVKLDFNFKIGDEVTFGENARYEILDIQGDDVTLNNANYETNHTSIRPKEEILGKIEKYQEFLAHKDSDTEKPLPQTSQNYKITDDTLGHGTPKEKFQANVLAIETLQAIEGENRQATPEEQEILAQYVGWGGLSEAFEEDKTAWASEYAILQDLLPEAEYNQARRTVLNSFYTSPDIIQSMYAALEDMKLPENSHFLEPSLGVGNFLGMKPEYFNQAQMSGTELDSISGRIATLLYPEAKIHVTGFEKANFKDNTFDVAIGNVPFGQSVIFDPVHNKEKFKIHDYFFNKSLDKVKTGGIVAFVTSKGTLDKEKSNVREALSQKADLLGAIRLPNTAFKENAGTEVTSDIIFLQKRAEPPEITPSWVNLGENQDGIRMNQYFIDNPEMIMGTMELVPTQYGPAPTCNPNTETTLKVQLEQAIQHLKQPDLDLLKNQPEIQQEEEEKPRDWVESPPDTRPFSYVVQDNEVFFNETGLMEQEKLAVATKDRVLGMVDLVNQTRKVIDMQLDDCSDKDLAKEQAVLNKMHDKFLTKHGTFASRGNKSAFSKDVSYPLLCSLENLDNDGKFKSKADIFTKRTIKNTIKVTSVDTPVEALGVSIGEKACIDIPFMVDLLQGKMTAEELTSTLNGIIFKNPMSDLSDPTTGWVSADEYLSGDVKDKLELVERLVDSHPELALNLEKLQDVQPTPLKASEIEVRLGTAWIDPKYYEQFMHEMLETPMYNRIDDVKLQYSDRTTDWKIKGKSVHRDGTMLRKYGTKRKNAYELLENSLNLKDTKVYDVVHDEWGNEKRVLNGKETTLAREKQELIAENFQNWVWKDPDRRDDLTQTYNALFNRTRTREFDGSHITFEGMTDQIKLRPHQENAVARSLYGGNTLLAHVVGAGKSFTMVASAMEGKRLGLHSKSLMVVPNHLTEQMGADIYKLYPAAKVLVTTKKDFTPANRKKFCAKIATGDFDVIVMGHSQFEKVPLSPERQQAHIEEQLDEIKVAIKDLKTQEGTRFSVKRMEETMDKLENKLKSLTESKTKDKVVTFEELGVDKLFVDESHNYKNLFFHTKMTNIAGVPQTDAQKSSDMLMKCRYMDELTGGKGITFATGTPISNSMVELYTNMKYLQQTMLKTMKLTHFDSWATTFGEKTTSIELSPEGTGFKARTRFAKFFNLPELMTMWKQVTDVQTSDMLNLPVPKVEHITVVSKPSEIQKDSVQDFAKRAKNVRDRTVKPNVDNMLKITSDGRKLALDQRLTNPLFPDDPDSKINNVVGNVHQIWENTTDIKGTQLVFCDMSTPKGDGTFNVYDDIRDKLEAKGIPKEQVAFIHEANTEAQKAALFSKVRSGEVRVLIGSTQKCGAGTNIQDKLVALHHTDCPWRPSDLEQREGRIVRQGNTNEEVKIFKYVTEGTFDAYNWATVEAKQKFIAQVFTSKSPARSADDVDDVALSYAEVKALATGDPRIKEKMELDVDVAKLKSMRSSHESECHDLQDLVRLKIPTKLQSNDIELKALAKDQITLKNNPFNSENFSMKVGDTTFTERSDAGKAIIELCKTIESREDVVQVGEFRGFPMEVHRDFSEYKLDLKGETTHTVTLSDSDVGNITRIINALELIPTKIEQCENLKVKLENDLESAKGEMDKPFPREAELQEKSKRLKKLNRELEHKGNDEEVKTGDKSVEKGDKSEKKSSVLGALKNLKNEVQQKMGKEPPKSKGKTDQEI